MIDIKILEYKAGLRYSLRRVVLAACSVIQNEQAGLEFRITEVKELAEILAYTQVLVSPALVINEKLVYDQWIPTRVQVIAWLREVVADHVQPGSLVKEQSHE